MHWVRDGFGRNMEERSGSVPSGQNCTQASVLMVTLDFAFAHARLRDICRHEWSLDIELWIVVDVSS